ncbi:cyclic AMP-dependent transcription factor ATF-6 beta [Ambystoma mexicanum]|uniref:cyclic AMP-dependent transcription factor ATF-6 beta n=1 Tax=Ambystoma mexicanum TaxID=8296 RepID=UPI0037E8B4CF
MGTELLLSELDSRFFADNLLSSEDWDASIYNYMETGEEHGDLFRCFDVDPLFDSAMELGLDSGPHSYAWNHLSVDDFPGVRVKSEPVRVKSEPVSPSSSHCSDSSLSSSSSDFQQQLTSADITVVKIESPPTPPCLFGDATASAFGSVQINVIAATEEVSGSTGKTSTGQRTCSILSRKTAIQPKPVLVAAVPVSPTNIGSTATAPTPSGNTILLQSVPSAPPIQSTISAQSVVLSQTDLLHLPVPGLLKVQPAKRTAAKSPSVSTAPTCNKAEAKTIVPAPNPSGSTRPQMDVKVLKRQQRMIKNRESACQSRKKKKEYMQGLESRLQEALSENEQLRRENAMLKKKLEGVLRENTEMKCGSGNRKVVCVMVLLLFIAFNFGPVSLTDRKSEALRQEVEPLHTARHLLEFREEERKEERLVYEKMIPASSGKIRFRNLSAAISDVKEMVLRDIDQLFLSSDCRQFNRTESLRLADELSGWVRRHQNGRKTGKPTQMKKTRTTKKLLLQKKLLNLARYVPAHPFRHHHREPSSQLQVYHRPDQTYNDFMDAIDRREDTFYVVSFRRDHLLLPAISHNKTSRPKMSLVMPAMALNESLYNSTRDIEMMMQIDCEVMDTRMIEIKSSTVPPFLRKEPDNRTTTSTTFPHESPTGPTFTRVHPRTVPITTTNPPGNLSLYLEDEKEVERGDGHA